jgi:hypothetical protein
VLGNSVNGTQYVGRRARTTGAPQNHWFGPAGDPRGAGIGTAYAIQLVWSCHREVCGCKCRGCCSHPILISPPYTNPASHLCFTRAH